MVRKQVRITEEQDRRLRVLAHQLGVSQSALVRQGIDLVLEETEAAVRRRQAWQAERRRSARLIEMGPVPGRRTWQRDELYDRPVMRHPR